MRMLFTFFTGAFAAILCAALPLAAATNDSDAGSWKMIVLSGPTQIAVPAPAPVTDPGYLSEVATIKAAQAHLTSAQRRLLFGIQLFQVLLRAITAVGKHFC